MVGHTFDGSCRCNRCNDYNRLLCRGVASHGPLFLCKNIQCALIHLIDAVVGMLRSYHHENTRSHQNSEVKRGWARLVLG